MAQDDPENEEEMPEFLRKREEQSLLVETWNGKYGVGTKVRADLGGGRILDSITRSRANLFDNQATIWLSKKDWEPRIPLAWVTPLEEPNVGVEKEPAQS